MWFTRSEIFVEIEGLNTTSYNMLLVTVEAFTTTSAKLMNQHASGYCNN